MATPRNADHAGQRDEAHHPQRRGHVELDQQGDRAAGNHRRHGDRVEEVLDRDAREGVHQRHAVAHERRLGRLAHEQAERREIAQRITTDEGRERVAQAQPVRWLGTEHPGPGPGREAQARQHDDREEGQADAPEAVGHGREAGFPQRVGKQREPAERGRGPAEAPGGGRARCGIGHLVWGGRTSLPPPL